MSSSTTRPRIQSFLFPTVLSDEDETEDNNGDDDTTNHHHKVSDQDEIISTHHTRQQEHQEQQLVQNLERLNSANGQAVTTIFRWQPPCPSSSSSSSSSLFDGAWSSLENLFAPLHSNTATDDEVDRKDEFVRHLTWDSLAINDCIFVPTAREDPQHEKQNMERTKALLSQMISSSLLAHGSIVVCSPVAKFSEHSLTQPTQVKDFVDGCSAIAVFISEYQFRTKILEPFSASLLELKRLRNLAAARVRAGGHGSRRKAGGSNLLRSGDGRRNADGDDDDDDDDDFKDFITHIFQSADVTPIDILQFSSDSVRVAESTAECQRTIPGLMKKDISRRRRENLKRYDRQLKVKKEQAAVRGSLRTDTVLAQREQDQIRDQHLSRGTTTLIAAHRYYEHLQRDFDEKLAMTAATLPPKKYDNKGNDISLVARKQLREQEMKLTQIKTNQKGSALMSYSPSSFATDNFIDLDHFYSSDNRGVIGVYTSSSNNSNNIINSSPPSETLLTQEEKKRAASATIINSQLFGGNIAVQFSRHLSVDDHHARRFVQGKYKENQEQRSQLAKYKRDMMKKQQQQQQQRDSHHQNDGVVEGDNDDGDDGVRGGANNNNTLLSRDLTDDEKIELRLKRNIERLDRQCHSDIELAASAVKEEMQSRLQTRRKLRENAAVEQGVTDALKGKERIRHRLAIERAAVLSMKELIDETSTDDRVGRRDQEIKDRIRNGQQQNNTTNNNYYYHRASFTSLLPSVNVAPVD